MSDLQKYQPEYGVMRESGVGQFVRLYDYRTLEGELDNLKRANEVLAKAVECIVERRGMKNFFKPEDFAGVLIGYEKIYEWWENLK